jgi:hypothetical protein
MRLNAGLARSRSAETHSLSYGSNRAGSGEGQVQAYLDKSGPG